MSVVSLPEGVHLSFPEFFRRTLNLSKVRVLKSVGNNIGDEGVAHIAILLETNVSVKELYIINNSVSNIGALDLAKMLNKNTTLKRLDLSKNNIGGEGAIVLAKALENNITLESFNLSENPYGLMGVLQLVESIAKNGMLIDVKGIDSVKKYTERNRRAHERCRLAIHKILLIGKIQKAREEANIPAGVPLSLFKEIAAYLWSTRHEKVWWLPEEGGSYAQQTNKIMRTNACIGCQRQEARFSEQNNPKRLFCSSYCQFMEKHKFPDFRGMTPDQIESVYS